MDPDPDPLVPLVPESDLGMFTIVSVQLLLVWSLVLTPLPLPIVLEISTFFGPFFFGFSSASITGAGMTPESTKFCCFVVTINVKSNKCFIFCFNLLEKGIDDPSTI